MTDPHFDLGLPPDIVNDDRYRYWLTRQITGWEHSTVCFVMLNPSTADDDVDDPTIRKCIGFARRMGFDRLTVGNLWPYRATKPRDLLACDDPDPGGRNTTALWALFDEADTVIVAWGANAAKMHAIGRNGPDIEGMLAEPESPPAYCFGYTIAGAPRHPLMLAYATEREPWVPS